EYLQKLAAFIQKQYGVLPQTTALDHEFHTEKDLALIPGIGSAYHTNLDFPRYAVQYAQPLSTQEHPDVQPLNLFEPSQSLRDERSSDVYIFRVTDAQKSHPPADKSEVLAQIQSDLRMAQAYKMAEADAKSFIATIKAPGGLSSAGKTVIHAGPLGTDDNQIPNYPLASPAK